MNELEVVESDNLPEPEVMQEEDSLDWLAISNDAFRVSDTYFNSSIRTQLNKNIDQFNSRHTSGSKYNTASYKFRSKIFRPKTRSSIRRHEAAAVTAFFSTSDVVVCEPEYSGDKNAMAGAEILQNLVNNRLVDPQLNWFLTCMGAYQDAMVQGVVISRQEWIYEDNGKKVEDRFNSVIVPTENFRFDPNADWRNPVATSPYLIELIPMYRGDVLRLSESRSPIPWVKLDSDVVLSSPIENNSTESSRTGGRNNPKDQKHEETDFDIVWVHRNIINKNGVDVLYYTVGETLLLSEPVLLSDVSPLDRDYVVGVCNIETHKNHPSAPIELYSGMQREINDIANQRLDNVKLAINRRSFVRRGANIDIRGLTNSVPGGITLVEDVDRDVRHDAPPDVTSSSYAEQDRLNNDFDELAGSFSGSSVASNRQMNETVGGMEIMSSDANSVTEYQLKIFSETWLKPTLSQFVKLVQAYETDEARLVSASMGLPPDQALALIQNKILTKLSVGYGATNPQKQVEKFAFGLNTLATFMPSKLQKLNGEEVSKEIFGALGFQDGKRFFLDEKEEDPRVQQLTQQVQQLTQQLQTKQAEIQGKIQVEQVKQQGNMQREQIRNETNKWIAQLNSEIAYISEQIAAEKNDVKREELVIQRDAFEESKKHYELEQATNERNRMSDVLMNNEYGMAPGIDEGPGKG